MAQVFKEDECSKNVSTMMTMMNIMSETLEIYVFVAMRPLIVLLCAKV
jgi:hypothetical protein